VPANRPGRLETVAQFVWLTKVMPRWDHKFRACWRSFEGSIDHLSLYHYSCLFSGFRTHVLASWVFDGPLLGQPQDFWVEMPQDSSHILFSALFCKLWRPCRLWKSFAMVSAEMKWLEDIEFLRYDTTRIGPKDVQSNPCAGLRFFVRNTCSLLETYIGS
jgi:hypothetical protein